MASTLYRTPSEATQACGPGNLISATVIVSREIYVRNHVQQERNEGRRVHSDGGGGGGSGSGRGRGAAAKIWGNGFVVSPPKGRQPRLIIWGSFGRGPLGTASSSHRRTQGTRSVWASGSGRLSKPAEQASENAVRYICFPFPIVDERVRRR